MVAELPPKHSLSEMVDYDHFVERPLAGAIDQENNNRCWWILFEDGSQLTVLDRLTGFSDGYRDTETGYRDADDAFWLASGQVDVRYYGGLTYAEAIERIKEQAHIKGYKR